MKRRVLVVVGGAGLGHAVGAALTAAMADAPRGPAVPRHPRELRDAPRAEGTAPKVRDWEFRRPRGRHPR